MVLLKLSEEDEGFLRLVLRKRELPGLLTGPSPESVWAASRAGGAKRDRESPTVPPFPHLDRKPGTGGTNSRSRMRGGQAGLLLPATFR